MFPSENHEMGGARFPYKPCRKSIVLKDTKLTTLFFTNTASRPPKPYIKPYENQSFWAPGSPGTYKNPMWSDSFIKPVEIDGFTNTKLPPETGICRDWNTL